MRTSHTLVNIDLGHNSLGFEGAKRLARVLRDNNTLEYINIEWNKIGTEGLKCIVDALKDNKDSHLSVLDVHSNQIDSEGAIVFFFLKKKII